MSELRWLLLVLGLAAFALIFWWSRREAAGKPLVPPVLRMRQPPRLGAAAEPVAAAESSEPSRMAGSQPMPTPERVVTVRLTGQGSATFSGEALLAALRDAGLQHGRFGIFHRHAPGNGQAIVFSVASLTEPGSFDLTRITSERFPGVTLFMSMPGAVDDVVAFDDMLSTARALASRLDGQLLDEQGSRLSVQRERFLREEVIQFQHKRLVP